MQKESLISLNIKQKLYAAAILFGMYALLCVMFILNGKGAFEADTSKGWIMLFLLAMIIAGMYFYLEAFSKKCIHQIKFIYLIALSFLAVFQLSLFFEGELLIYARPLYAFAMIMTILVGKKEGLFLNAYFVAALYLFDVYIDGYNFVSPAAVYTVLSFLLSGMVAVIFTAQNNRRLDTVLSAFKIGLFAFFTGISLFTIINGFDISVFFIGVACYLSAFFSLLLFLGMLPLLERYFNIVTAYRLNELTDHNRSLLKQLAMLAPGTFNHSLAVSNLAEACAIAIGENAQLARAAAYYHDIGKIKYPLYFKENQTDYNPHDDLTPELSVSFIRKHAIEGYEMCRRNRLPEEIASICLEHHGTTVIKYFYYEAKKYTESDLSTQQYRYGGPKPQSKIAAIIMIADAAEALIRVLNDRSKATIENQVKQLIDERMELEQFSECDITMADIYKIIETIVRISAGIYHERTQYPQLKFSKYNKEETAEPEKNNEGKKA
jgi:putative nucleotidyltransferase with HDIG domain